MFGKTPRNNEYYFSSIYHIYLKILKTTTPFTQNYKKLDLKTLLEKSITFITIIIIIINVFIIIIIATITVITFCFWTIIIIIVIITWNT